MIGHLSNQPINPRDPPAITTQQQHQQKQAFQGRGGRAFLLDAVVNTVTGPPEDRLLMTGVHTVADLCCGGCKALLGWKYVSLVSAAVVVRCILIRHRYDRTL